jgi:hypothetical protein
VLGVFGGFGGVWINICRVFCDGFDEEDDRDKNEICK